MTRIFLTLSFLSTAFVGFAMYLGLSIGDPTVRELAVQNSVSVHMLTGLLGLIFAALVHAIVLTYFMGTGRWIEETSKAYRLPEGPHGENQSLKYRLLPGMTACILMLVLTAAFGAVSDPASQSFSPTFGVHPSTVHLAIACLTIAVNVLVSVHEFRSIERNGEIVDGIMSEVNRIRTERGLPVRAE